MYMMHLLRFFTPSSGPGSGNRMGLMCAGWSSPMDAMANLGAGEARPSETFVSSMPSILSPPVSAREAEDPPISFRPPPTDATFPMALSGDGSAATISGLSDWKSRKPMG